MKNHLSRSVVSIGVIISIFILLMGCSSKEERANKLIKERMSKTLFDYASYDPIETIVTEAKASLYTDTSCWRMGDVLYLCMSQAIKYNNEAKEAQERMEIWGPPTYYSSSYSDSKYRKYKSEYEDANSSFMASMILCNMISDSLKQQVSRLDENEVIGWEVIHKFRCKTKGGYATIGNYRFVMDKGFDAILIEEDMDSDESKGKRTTITECLNNDWID